MNHHIEIRHKLGAHLPLADALSRMFHDSEKREFAYTMISNERLQLLQPALNEYQFFNPFL